MQYVFQAYEVERPARANYANDRGKPAIAVFQHITPHLGLLTVLVSWGLLPS